MANHNRENFGDAVERAHAAAARATGRDSQSGRAENLGGARSYEFVTTPSTPIKAHDTTLSWGGGQPVAPAGLGDTTEFPIEASAVYPRVVKATKPSSFGASTIPVKNHNSSCNGVDAIARATEIGGK